MQFNARIFNSVTGAVAERIVDGDSFEGVSQQLARDGWTVLTISKRERLKSKKYSDFNLALFCEELRTLLTSGMSLVEAIDALALKHNDENKYAILADMKQRLLEGKSFSCALETNPFPFPLLLIASIRASERSSRLNDALDEFITYDKVGQELKKKILSAMIYPCLVAAFGLLVCLFMISYVVPRFSKVYEDFAQNLNLSTLMLIRLGQFVDANAMSLQLGAIAFAGAFIYVYRNGQLKQFILFASGRFFITQHYARLYQLARIYQTISMLLKGGYTLVDAIPLALHLAFDAGLQSRLTRAHGAISEGKRLSVAFSDNGLTDSVAERLLQVGERSGNLPKILDIIAQSYRQEFTLFMERATRLAEPILLMAVGLMTGALIVMMYMPVFDLAGGI